MPANTTFSSAVQPKPLLVTEIKPLAAGAQEVQYIASEPDTYTIQVREWQRARLNTMCMFMCVSVY